MPDYGNVPEDDVLAVHNAVAVAARVAASTPENAPAEWREAVYEAALAGILGDWVANGTTELDEEDEADLANLAALAVDVALAQGESLRLVTFRTVLESVIHDWVENWNSDEE